MSCIRIKIQHRLIVFFLLLVNHIIAHQDHFQFQQEKLRNVEKLEFYFLILCQARENGMYYYGNRYVRLFLVLLFNWCIHGTIAHIKLSEIQLHYETNNFSVFLIVSFNSYCIKQSGLSLTLFGIMRMALQQYRFITDIIAQIEL